jgi:hypothetical protein
MASKFKNSTLPFHNNFLKIDKNNLLRKSKDVFELFISKNFISPGDFQSENGFFFIDKLTISNGYENRTKHSVFGWGKLT